MAKKTTKTSAKAGAVEMLGGVLPKGEGLKIKRAFDARLANSGATNLPGFPEAVCLTVTELRAFLNEVEKVVNPDPLRPVPPNEIGVAIMHAFRNGRVTTMLVATRFTENKLLQKVLTINNPVTGIQWYDTPPAAVKSSKKTAKKAMKADGDDDPIDPPVGELVYDTSSTFP